MDFNSIQKIVEAEKKAEEIRSKAREDAKKILADLQGKEENAKLFHQTQLKRKVDEFKLAQDEEKNKKIEEIKSSATEMARNIRESSEKNMSNAVDDIFKYVVLD